MAPSVRFANSGIRPQRYQPRLEALEPRWLLSTNVLTYHDDLARTGLNPNESLLNLSNVNTGAFGKLFSFSVDGQVYAQPLYMASVTITTGPLAGVHNVV